jgi:hypothetical protein
MNNPDGVTPDKEQGAAGEDLVGPDSPDELLANARAGIKALECKVREQVEQHIDACLAVALDEAASLSTELRDTKKERAARRKAAKKSASRWKRDVERPSGILGLFKSCLSEVTGHIDKLDDKAAQTSLMVNLGFLLRASGSTAVQLTESKSNELNALKELNKHRTRDATHATEIASALVDEIILKRACPHRTNDGWKRGTPGKIEPGVNRDIKKRNAEEACRTRI